jgi:hypothetical protein
MVLGIGRVIFVVQHRTVLGIIANSGAYKNIYMYSISYMKVDSCACVRVIGLIPSPVSIWAHAYYYHISIYYYLLACFSSQAAASAVAV